jgi:hypothetical protein
MQVKPAKSGIDERNSKAIQGWCDRMIITV